MNPNRKRPSEEGHSEGSPAKLRKEDRYGSTGTPVQLSANYFRLNKMPDFVLTQYRVDFEPDLDVTATRKKLIFENKSQFGNRYIFDGASLYLGQNFDQKIIHTIFNDRPVQIKIKRTGDIRSDDPAAFQLFNLIFRESMAGLKLQRIRRDYFDPNAKINVPKGNLELWPGYITSIRAHENDVLMCSEISHKFMRNDTILKIAKDFIISHNQGWAEALKKEIIGTTVLTDYTNKTYQIDEIDFNMNPMSTFTPCHKDEAVTYKEYYESRYNIKITDDKQFLLVSKAKERDLRAGRSDVIYLIPELCRATGMTDSMRADFSLMRELSEFTRLNPEKRVRELEKFNKRVQETPESVAVLNEWNMQLERELMTVPARELPAEPILLGDDQETNATPKGEWMIRKGSKMYKPVEINRWICIFPESLEHDTESFIRTLKSACAEMSCEIKDPFMVPLGDDRQETYISKIRQLAEKLPRLFLIVLPTNRADRYSAVKKLSLIDLGIPTQVLVKRTLNNKNIQSIATKVAIQMNAKLGGLPWMVKLPVKGLMTVGFDVSLHPRDKSRSVGALVATMDLKKTGTFFSRTSEYRDGNEMNNGLAHQMKQALSIYQETCGALPEKILFYRDGVGEGQIQYLKDKEISPLMAKLKAIYGDQDPKLAYIVVNKRTNTRMFKKAGSSYVNPKPGTVVDQGITLPERNDFFLISQHVGQGTVSPTAYNVIFNNSGLDKDKLEILTYKFTHLYFNWSGTTRIPSVCQYAKKLAFLTSQSLQGPVNRELERFLYFL